MSRSITLITVAAASLFCLNASGADTPGPGATPTPGERSFAALDKDKDGKISATEARANDKLARLFTGLDADKDGSLSRDEFAAYDPAGATKDL